MGTTATLRLDETEKAIIQNYASSKGMTMSEFMKKIVLDYIEDEYDLKIYKEYLKEKENRTLKTYSHKEVWGEKRGCCKLNN